MINWHYEMMDWHLTNTILHQLYWAIDSIDSGLLHYWKVTFICEIANLNISSCKIKICIWKKLFVRFLFFELLSSLPHICKIKIKIFSLAWKFPFSSFLGCEEGAGLCAMLITIGSLLLIVASLPLSLFFVVKVVQVMSTNVLATVKDAGKW